MQYFSSYITNLKFVSIILEFKENFTEYSAFLNILFSYFKFSIRD